MNKEKVDIHDRKVDVESVISEKGSDFSVKTTVHIHRLFEKFGFDEVFGRSAVMDHDIIKLPSEASVDHDHELQVHDIIELPHEVRVDHDHESQIHDIMK